MKILYFGDVFGRPGREAVKKAIAKLVNPRGVDFTIVNGENMAHGRGLTPEQARELFSAGADAITTGNHAWDQKEILSYFDEERRLLRPANFPNVLGDPTPGRGRVVLSHRTKPGVRLGLFQVMGRVFMDSIDCPFAAAEREIGLLKSEGAQVILADFHGEASSEKQAFANFLDGRVGGVVSSHWHVQTADERILPGGTAAITDVGMCGVFDSVIGMRKDLIIRKFRSKRPIKAEPAEGQGGYSAVLIDIDEATGLARSIERLHERTI